MATTAIPPAESAAPARPVSPYPGLRPFNEDDARIFFGRSSEVEIVAANLLSSRLTLVYGAAGVGKTSVLLAGVVHALREQSRMNLDDEDEFNDFAVVVIGGWSDPDPNAAIAAAARAEVVALLGHDDVSDPPGDATLAEVLRHWSELLGGKLLVIFDQFEEYFRYHDDERRAGTFDAEFPQAVNGVDVPVHFLLSVRDDELARLDHFKGRIPKLFDNRVKIDHLTCDGAEQAIRKPLEKLPADGQVGIEDALVAALLAHCAVWDPLLDSVAESSDGPASPVRVPTGSVTTPLLQLVLQRLWRTAAEAGERTLTLAQHERLGGVEGILDSHLRAALNGLSPREQDIAAKCFGVLVSPAKTKIAYPASVLMRVAGTIDAAEVTAVLDKLCSVESGHILTAVETGDGNRSYELSNADLLADPIITWQKEFDEAQRRRAEDERRLAIRRKYRNRLGLLFALVVIFAALFVWAWGQRNDANRAARAAASVALASTADEELASHRDVALLLSLEAYRAKKTPQAERSMRAALAAVQSSGASILRGNQGGVTAVALSEDGKTLAVAGSDGTVVLWDTAGHTKLGGGLKGDHGAVTALSLHASTLAAAYADGTVLLWNLKTQTTQESLSPRRKNAGAVTTLAFSKNGTTLAAADSDGTLRIWNHGARNGKWTRFGQVLGNDASPINGMVLSEDGEAIAATSSFNGKIRIWLRENGRWTLSGTESAKKLSGRAITAVALNPDGHTLAAAFEPDFSATGTGPNTKAAVMLWDLNSEKQGRVIPLDKTGINGIAFSRNGKRLATAGADGTVHVFDAHALTLTEHGRPLNGHQGPASSVVFAKDGKVLASGYNDGTVLLWRLDARNASSNGHRMSDYDQGSGSVAFSLDGKKFATATLQDTETVQLWDAHGRKLGRPLDGSQEDIWTVSFSPDGKLITAVDGNGKVVLWNTRKPFERVGVFNAGGGLYSVAFSRDGKTLATAGDGGVQRWDLRTHKKLGTAIDPHQGGVAAIAFSPKGNTLAIANFNGTVQLWDMTTSTPVIKPLYVGKNGVVDVAFRPDGDMLATAGTDGTVRLWDIRDLEHPTSHLLSGNQQYVWGVAFSADGDLVASAGDDGTVAVYNLKNHTRRLVKSSRDVVYDVAFSKDRTLAAAGYNGTVLWYAKDIDLPWRDLDDLKARACALVSGNLTKSEWTALVPPGQSYRTTCPAR